MTRKLVSYAIGLLLAGAAYTAASVREGIVETPSHDTVRLDITNPTLTGAVQLDLTMTKVEAFITDDQSAHQPYIMDKQVRRLRYLLDADEKAQICH